MTDPTRRTLLADSMLRAIPLSLPLAAIPFSVDATPLIGLSDVQRNAPPAGDTSDMMRTKASLAEGVCVNSLAELKALVERPAIAFVTGFRSPNDGGGGLFSWNPGSTVNADDVLAVAPSDGPSGRYIRHGDSTINVRWAGASGLGDTDDTAAFRAALAAGSTVFVPPGLYRLTGTLRLEGATIFGSGPQSILKCGHPGFNLFDVGGTGSRIERLSILGAATDATTAQFGIVTSKSSPPKDLSISDVRFSGPSPAVGLNNGIKFEDHATNCRVLNNHFEQLIGAARNGYGVLTGAVDGLIVSCNSFQGSRSAAQGRHAIYVSAGGCRVNASHNIIREFNSEALATNAYAHQQPVDQLIFTHNIIYRCGGDGSNQSSIGIIGRAETIRVEGNIVIESFGCGILCDAGSVIQGNVAVDGNTVIDASYMGIRQHGALQQSVRNNYVRGSSRRTPGAWADIVVGSGGVVAPEQILVSGNQCIPAQGSAKAFVLNISQPLPKIVSLYGNVFPTIGYQGPPDYASGQAKCQVDGRIQLSAYWEPSALAAGTSTTQQFAMLGVELGDIVVCGHSPALPGLIFSGTAIDAGWIGITAINLSSADINSLAIFEL